MSKKKRTSITIEPELLNAARAIVQAPDSQYRSVSAFFEVALTRLVNSENLNGIQQAECVQING